MNNCTYNSKKKERQGLLDMNGECTRKCEVFIAQSMKRIRISRHSGDTALCFAMKPVLTYVCTTNSHQFGLPSTTTEPTNQAGHHTPQTTTLVYIPHTRHPKAASRSTSPRLLTLPWPPCQFADPIQIVSTAVGATRFSTVVQIQRMTVCLGQGLAMNDSGHERRPTMSEREKLSVARDERNMPSSKREKHCIRVYCWAVGQNLVVRRLERRCGRAMLAMVRTAKTGVCI